MSVSAWPDTFILCCIFMIHCWHHSITLLVKVVFPSLIKCFGFLCLCTQIRRADAQLLFWVGFGVCSDTLCCLACASATLSSFSRACFTQPSPFCLATGLCHKTDSQICHWHYCLLVGALSFLPSHAAFNWFLPIAQKRNFILKSA